MAEWKGWRWRDWRHDGGRQGAKARQSEAKAGRTVRWREGGVVGRQASRRQRRKRPEGKLKGGAERRKRAGGWDEGGQTDWKEGEDRRTDGEDRKQGEWYVRETERQKRKQNGRVPEARMILGTGGKAGGIGTSEAGIGTRQRAGWYSRRPLRVRSKRQRLVQFER